MISLNNVTTTDQYTNANTIAQADTARINLYVSNNGILWSWAVRGGAFHPDEFLPVNNYSFDFDDVERVRIKSGSPGNAAVVTVTLKTKADLGLS